MVQVLENLPSPLGRSCLLLFEMDGLAAARRRLQREPISVDVLEKSHIQGAGPPPPSSPVSSTLGPRFSSSLGEGSGLRFPG